MKKISFEEAIKVMKNGGNVYDDTGEFRYCQNNDGIICRYYQERLNIFNISLFAGDKFYLPEESERVEIQIGSRRPYKCDRPKPFEITKTGLYKTRDGRRAFVAAERGGVKIGCIDEFPILLRWGLTGEVKDGYVAGLDIVEEWGDDE